MARTQGVHRMVAVRGGYSDSDILRGEHVMPAFSLEFEVYCGKCGDGLCLNSDTDETRTRRMPFVKVKPCERCIDDAKEDAFDRGKDEGIREAEKKYEEDA